MLTTPKTIPKEIATRLRKNIGVRRCRLEEKKISMNSNGIRVADQIVTSRSWRRNGARMGSIPGTVNGILESIGASGVCPWARKCLYRWGHTRLLIISKLSTTVWCFRGAQMSGSAHFHKQFPIWAVLDKGNSRENRAVHRDNRKGQ